MDKTVNLLICFCMILSYSFLFGSILYESYWLMFFSGNISIILTAIVAIYGDCYDNKPQDVHCEYTPTFIPTKEIIMNYIKNVSIETLLDILNNKIVERDSELMETKDRASIKKNINDLIKTIEDIPHIDKPLVIFGDNVNMNTRRCSDMGKAIRFIDIIKDSCSNISLYDAEKCTKIPIVGCDYDNKSISEALDMIDKKVKQREDTTTNG